MLIVSITITILDLLYVCVMVVTITIAVWTYFCHCVIVATVTVAVLDEATFVFRCNHICNLAVSDRTFVNLLMVLHGRGHLCCLFRQFISESAFLKPNTEPTNSVFCIACAKIGF